VTVDEEWIRSVGISEARISTLSLFQTFSAQHSWVVCKQTVAVYHENTLLEQEN